MPNEQTTTPSQPHVSGRPTNVSHDTSDCTCGVISHMTTAECALKHLLATIARAGTESEESEIAHRSAFARNCEKAEWLDRIIAAKDSYDAALVEDRVKVWRPERKMVGDGGESGDV